MAKTGVPPSRVSGKRSARTEIRIPPLVCVFERLTDWRKARGQVYSLTALPVFV